ncbi:MAG: ATP synthase F1 subunit gamma [Planctomycetota bacterium]|nr:ATP synthase F1 subunit gamma [Planctomycetota bacterium]
MANTRDIVKRRKSVRNTKKITRTMELISTAKFKQASDRIKAAAPYADHLARVVGNLASSLGEEAGSHPLLRRPEKVEKVAVLVLAANRGLCGGYNVNLINAARSRVAELEAQGISVELHVVGKKAIQFFLFTEVPMANEYSNFEDRPAYEDVRPIAEGFMRRFSDGELDRVEVVYTRFISSGRQRLTTSQLLPIEPPQEDDSEESSNSGDHSHQYHYIYEPDARGLRDELLPHVVKMSCFTFMLHAAASEQVARMVAMKNATDAAEKMIKSLTQQYNRARQTQITTEIAEIIGGVAALE